MKRIKKAILTLFVLIMMLCLFTGCDKCDEFNFHIPTFEEKCVTTEDGFVYYPIENEAYIIKIPETEEVTIPEYIDGKKVVQLGYEEDSPFFEIGTRHFVGSETIKVLTIQHTFTNAFIGKFTKLKKIMYFDYPYCTLKSGDFVKVWIPRQSGYTDKVEVELRKSNRDLDITDFGFKTILIPDYVTVIEDGVFDGLEDVTIKTSYESKPDGWEDGWNGTCAVEWGVGVM